jgi:GDPmannose 4,6-dehydratase
LTLALVTGITGQDGSLLAEQLAADGERVVGLARREVEGYEIVEGDLLDPPSLRAAVREVRPDVLYHLAAPTFVPASWEDPAGTFAAVAGATGTLLDAALRVDGVRVVAACSSEIFGDAGEWPQHERSPMRPWSPYGAAKLAAHHLVRIYREQRGLHASSAITFNHESERRPERFLPRKVARTAAAIRLGLEGELVVGDLDAVRDWSAARDVVRGYRLMAAQDEPDDYVLASGEGRTVRELVDAAFAAVGLDAGPYLRVDPGLVRAPEATPLVGDPTHARERLGWVPETSFEDLIEEMVQADLARLAAA